MPEAVRKTAGRGCAAAIASASAWVVPTRLVLSSRLRRAVQNGAPIEAPARFTTASAPASAKGSLSQPTTASEDEPALRETHTTSCPSELSEEASALPT